MDLELRSNSEQYQPKHLISISRSIRTSRFGSRAPATTACDVRPTLRSSMPGVGLSPSRLRRSRSPPSTLDDSARDHRDDPHRAFWESPSRTIDRRSASTTVRRLPPSRPSPAAAAGWHGGGRRARARRAVIASAPSASAARRIGTAGSSSPPRSGRFRSASRNRAPPTSRGRRTPPGCPARPPRRPGAAARPIHRARARPAKGEGRPAPDAELRAPPGTLPAAATLRRQRVGGRRRRPPGGGLPIFLALPFLAAVLDLARRVALERVTWPSGHRRRPPDTPG